MRKLKLDPRYKLKRNISLYKDKLSGAYTNAELVEKYKISQQSINNQIRKLKEKIELKVIDIKKYE